MLELLYYQLVYIAILFFIILRAFRKKRNITPFWIITGLYFLTMVWLCIGYLTAPKPLDPGGGFAIGMYSLLIPGVLIIVSIWISLNQGGKNSG